jgi:general secretion pathway protein E
MARFLADSGLLAEDAFARVEAVHRSSREPIEVVATRLGLVSEQALQDALARATGLAVVPAPDRALASEPAMPIAFLRDIRAVAIACSDEAVTVAVADPFDPFVESAFANAWHRPVTCVLTRATDIDSLIEKLAAGSEDGAAAEDETAAVVDGEAMERLRDLVSDAPAIRAVNRLIAAAVDQRASDIHLEPSEDDLSVRFRIDGELREADRLPAALRTSAVARIKVMAGLDIAERRLPQDGRLRLAVRGHQIDLRVATAPSIHGESVVMRILDRSNLALDFAALGFDEALTRQWRSVLHRPHGIVLVTGPTGSGKTTTLYAALAELNGVKRKLLTIEDPIEYRLPGVIQSQVQPAIGYSFANALRSFLRQDPDIIMVGEIRDGETARIAVRAALTGHMILSTLHTNTAAGAIGRLADMGIEPFLLASVLSGVMAQRLVRRLCPHCRVPHAPDPALLATAGVEHGTFYQAAGCPQCQNTGYSGRIALFEYLPITPEVQRLILQNRDETAIEEAADRQGRHSLITDGYRKAAQGLTSIEEVLRVGFAE